MITFIAAVLIGRVLRPRQRFQRNFRKPNYRARFKRDQSRDRATAKQVRIVMAASFERRKILNWPEYCTFRIIEDEIATAYRGYRVFAQTSLGEILSSSNDDAFFAINNKRADILIVDRSGLPVLAIEYQGSGHYQGTAIGRDTIKRAALQKAGVGYLEIFEGDGDEQIRLRLHEHLGYASDVGQTQKLARKNASRANASYHPVIER
jgi:hypothetical protein